MKKIMLLALTLIIGFNANAQLGGLVRKGLNKATEKVTKNNANSKQTTTESSSTKKSCSDDDLEALLNDADGSNGHSKVGKIEEPYVDANSSGAELSRALNYWLDKTEQAVFKKDVEWLCSDKAENSYDIMQMLRKRLADGKTDGFYYDKEKPRYSEVTRKVSALLLDGAPELGKPLTGNEYLVASIKWYIGKADNGGPNAKKYMVMKAADMRRRAFESGRYKDTPEVQQVTEQLKARWAKFDEAYKSKNAIDDPNLSYAQIVAAKDKKDQQEKADQQARIDASKKSLTAGSLDASLNAQILKVARKRMPETIKVVVENDSWSYKKNGIVIEYRFVSAWVISKDKDGNLVAHDYTFAQDYAGGGKYGAMRYNGIGLRTVYVK